MHAGLVARMRLEADLRKALAEDQFVVHYQPMVSMRTGEITGVEALVRWQHPERGLVPPNDFIPLAEATGLIRPLGLWVLRESCRQAVAWEAAGHSRRGLKLSVNVSARQLQQDDLVEQVVDVLRETGLPAQQLTLEMTESVLLDEGRGDPGHAHARYARPGHPAGDRRLRHRLLVAELPAQLPGRHPQDRPQLRRAAVHRRRHGADQHHPPAGEDHEARDRGRGHRASRRRLLMLRRQGCTTGQGYHFSPPVPATRLQELLAEASPEGRPAVPAPRQETRSPGRPSRSTDVLPVEAPAGRP